MDTLAQTPTLRHTTIRIETHHPTQFIDVTDEVNAFVRNSRVQTGLINIQVLHTTTAVFVNEHEPLLLGDSPRCSRAIAPQDGVYRHDNVSLRTAN